VLWVGIVAGWGDYSGYDGYFDDFTINGDTYYLEPPGTVALTTHTLPSIVAISVDPTSIDFGTLYPGQSSGTTDITVLNIGTVIVDVDASVEPTPTVFDNLELAGTSPPSAWLGMAGLAVDASDAVGAQLVVPLAYVAAGEETATLIFEASPSS